MSNIGQPPVAQNAVLISPAWDSLIRSVLQIGGAALAISGHGTPDQIQMIGTTLIGSFGAIFSAGAAIWGVTHKVLN